MKIVQTINNRKSTLVKHFLDSIVARLRQNDLLSSPQLNSHEHFSSNAMLIMKFDGIFFVVDVKQMQHANNLLHQTILMKYHADFPPTRCMCIHDASIFRSCVLFAAFFSSSAIHSNALA